MARRRTRAEAEIEARLSTLEPGSKRYDVLAAVRDFKASWVQVGERLTAVREGGHFREWGYSSFEAYCRRELRIKTDTANKLTRSFSFLRDHQPKALEEKTERELPPLEVVDLLSQARERANVSDEQLDNIREEVFAAEAAPTRNQVVQRFREVDPEAFKPKPRQNRAQANPEIRKALLLAERLEGVLQEMSDVSGEAVAAARRVVGELRKRFEEQRKSA